MKKDKKFLKDLEKNLVGIKDKYKQEILAKYENTIKEEKEKNRKITVILKEIGSPADVASKEIEALGNKGKESFFDVARKRIKEYSENRKINREAKNKLKDEKNANKRLNDKNVKVSVGNKNVNIDKVKEKEKLEKEKKKLKEKKEQEKKELKEKKEKLKEEKNKNKKEKEKKVKKEKTKKESKFDKEKFKERLAKIKEFFVKDRFVKKERKVTDTPKEIVEEIKEEFEEEVSEVSEIITEKKFFESKEVRKKRILLRTIGVLLTIVLLFLWLWVCVVFIASIIAYLDGVKFIGINIGLFGLSLLMLWIVVMVNRSIFGKKMSMHLNLVVVIISIILIALGIVLTLKQISDIKTVKDVSVKYSMTTKMSSYDLPEDKAKPFTLTFNSNYNTQYTVNYDERMKDKVKIEVKYYECYYDYYIKQSANNAYISLKLDKRDRLSVYIDDIKEGLVFDNDELSRYSVKITLNEKDMNRLVILD